MWLIVLPLVIGLSLGLKIQDSAKLLKFNSQFTLVALLLLLFIMGINLGMESNNSILLRDIGVKSVVFALAAVITSTAAVWCLAKLWRDN